METSNSTFYTLCPFHILSIFLFRNKVILYFQGVVLVQRIEIASRVENQQTSHDLKSESLAVVFRRLIGFLSHFHRNLNLRTGRFLVSFLGSGWWFRFWFRHWLPVFFFLLRTFDLACSEIDWLVCILFLKRQFPCWNLGELGFHSGSGWCQWGWLIWIENEGGKMFSAVHVSFVNWIGGRKL